jgi:cbb3-type cytochrome oxidase maturation protein
MEILLLLIPLSVVLILIIGGVLWWAVRSDQFEDLEGAGDRILLDDDNPETAAAPRRRGPENLT